MPSKPIYSPILCYFFRLVEVSVNHVSISLLHYKALGLRCHTFFTLYSLPLSLPLSLITREDQEFWRNTETKYKSKLFSPFCISIQIPTYKENIYKNDIRITYPQKCLRTLLLNLQEIWVEKVIFDIHSWN